MLVLPDDQPWSEEPRFGDTDAFHLRSCDSVTAIKAPEDLWYNPDSGYALLHRDATTRAESE